MDAIKRQASKLRDQVAKQQQVFKQFSSRFTQDLPPTLVDEEELECYHNLQKLYSSTRAAKHLQRNIVRGLEGLIAVGTKQMEIVKKLGEDCCSYGNEYRGSGFSLARAALLFGTSHTLIEKERESLLRVLGEQVFQPLRVMILGAPLEDARVLTHRYERIRQDVESQIADVMRKQLKSKEGGANAESTAKLQYAESKLSELRRSLEALGKEATAAMQEVEAQQQQTTFERLLAMVDAERAYHANVTTILEKLHEEMLLAKEPVEPSPDSAAQAYIQSRNSFDALDNASTSGELTGNGHPDTFFVGEVVHSFTAQADGELSISVGDYVVVRKVSPTGWSEGECRGKAGWFPSAYVECRDRAPASKLALVAAEAEPQSPT